MGETAECIYVAAVVVVPLFVNCLLRDISFIVVVLTLLLVYLYIVLLI